MRYFLIFFLLILNDISHAQSAEKIHFNAILVDTHNDFLSKAVDQKVVFDTNLKGITQSDLNRMRKGGVKVQMFSIFCNDNLAGSSSTYLIFFRCQV